MKTKPRGQAIIFISSFIFGIDSEQPEVLEEQQLICEDDEFGTTVLCSHIVSFSYLKTDIIILQEQQFV